MTKQELITLSHTLENEYKAILPRYLKILNSYKSDHHFVNNTNINKADDLIFTLANKYTKTIKLKKTDKDFLYHFIQIHDNYRLLIDIIKNNSFANYIDSAIVTYKEEDLLIIDPLYITEDYESLKNILYSSILTNDVRHEVITDTNDILGYFFTHSHKFCIMPVKTMLNIFPSISDVNSFISERNEIMTLIPNFTGKVQIKVSYDEGLYSYISGIGNVNFISKAIQL